MLLWQQEAYPASNTKGFSARCQARHGIVMENCPVKEMLKPKVVYDQWLLVQFDVLQESEVNAEGAVGDELTERFRTITERLQSLKLETDEVYCLMHLISVQMSYC